MSGVELFYEVYYEVTGAECEVKPSGCYNKSPEYFAGWSLAYYSWYRNMSYDDIQKIIEFLHINILTSPDVAEFLFQNRFIYYTPSQKVFQYKRHTVAG